MAPPWPGTFSFSLLYCLHMLPPRFFPQAQPPQDPDPGHDPELSPGDAAGGGTPVSEPQLPLNLQICVLMRPQLLSVE